MGKDDLSFFNQKGISYSQEKEILSLLIKDESSYSMYFFC